MQEFDVVIIGGGPIGIACGLEAKKRGLSYIIIEKGPIVNSLFNYPINMQFFSSSEKLEIDGIPFISKEAKPKRNEALEYYRRIVTSNQLDIHLFEKVITVEKENDIFQVNTDKDQYKAKNVVVATGFYDLPNRINVPGEDLPKVSHYYKDPHFYASQKLAVIGASNSAIDAALECWRKGAEVSLIIRGPEVGPRVKYWVRPDIINRIEEGSIKAYYNSTVKEIAPREIIIDTPEGETSLENDFVLALTGYMPNFTFLERLGIALSDDEKRLPSYDPETMETNVPGLFLAGVICGGMETHKWFIENSRIHAPIIMDAITHKEASV
ncbi:YpdA family putative bacillithiol disulfide reductase [Flagellimonas taeanensis]|uniref:YpdA family putative bacillithiol disulfide reductase n=1 Tax=Flavobacteriaceae TaxID=49546 RepID=UPI000E6909F5|nr:MULTISPECIES: YpdA family putative bacillithiol disulfide reductase [Allomuricauda]MDC6384301.1 YpdA family putative bacillithiol disulfide reductase [Muricauda sp. SK9]RIV49656.1 YpdA family putative bacillithiol disulfide reductase [Allomuricauda taeanensis]RIV53855.1 YpdA family putative bacillithiol disulfide reductase [Allomuricauda taeanensis]